MDRTKNKMQQNGRQIISENYMVSPYISYRVYNLCHVPFMRNVYTKVQRFLLLQMLLKNIAKNVFFYFLMLLLWCSTEVITIDYINYCLTFEHFYFLVRKTGIIYVHSPEFSQILIYQSNRSSFKPILFQFSTCVNNLL